MIPEINTFFDRYKFGWLEESSKSYSQKLVHDLYATYSALIDVIISLGQWYRDQPLLSHTLVWGIRVDIFELSIQRLVFWLTYEVLMSTKNFYYCLDTMKNRTNMKDPKKERELLSWVANYIYLKLGWCYLGYRENCDKNVIPILFRKVLEVHYVEIVGSYRSR